MALTGIMKACTADNDRPYLCHQLEQQSYTEQQRAISSARQCGCYQNSASHHMTTNIMILNKHIDIAFKTAVQLQLISKGQLDQLTMAVLRLSHNHFRTD